MDKELKFISVVAYVYNDENQIVPFLSGVMETCREVFEKCELILINDNSTDRSLDRIHSYFRENPADYMVSVVKLGISQGIEEAMNIGRDMVGTMTNTLILTFLGSEFTLMIFLYARELTFYHMFSTAFISLETISGISASIGMVLAIPLTALISATLIKRNKS